MAKAANNNAGGNPDPPQTGKPADGSVGNADGKTPKGQSPNDKNKGHECDKNKGIGRGNPAHTGCAAPAVTPTPTPTPNPVVNPTPTTNATTTAAVAAASQVPAAQVLGVQITRAPAAVAGLARTGPDAGDQAAVALALLILGTSLVLLSRRLTCTV